MTPHHLLTRLAKYFHVVWSEPPLGWRDVIRGLNREITWLPDSGSRTPDGFQIYVPAPWLPQFYRPKVIASYTFEQRVKNGIRKLKRQGCRHIVLYLWHPTFEPALRSSDFDLSLYHIDDEYSFAAAPSRIDPLELQVLNAVDQVFVVSPGLLERKGGINPHTAFMPEGVDYQLYATSTNEPDDLVAIPHPRIGYTGNLKKQLDWQLLRELAARHREWSFVFVGPSVGHQEVDEAIKEISHWNNVYFLGVKSVTNLALYPQHFDVCIMPYRVTGYTNNIYPLKLHEYLASGRPVVGSPIRSLKDFSSVIELAETTEDWSHALIHALDGSANCSKAVAARQKIAREHDWSNLVSSLAQTICERLGLQYSVKFPRP